MIFSSPLWLALVPVIAVAFLARRIQAKKAGERASGKISFSSLAGFSGSPVTWRARAVRTLPWMQGVAMIAVVLALARPQHGFEVTEAVTEGITIAMAIDVSSSMSALDLGEGEGGTSRNRLQVVQQTFSDFIAGKDDLPGRESDLVSLIAFARYADSLTPPTLDHETLLRLVDSLEPVSEPEEDGTAVGDAILAGLDSLSSARNTSRVMVLLTDGSHNAGLADPLRAAEAAEALDVRIYTIGAGSQGRAEIPARPGETSGRRMQVFIDEFTLTKIAETTGGKYFRATNIEGLRAIYAEIDRLEKNRNVARNYQRSVDLYPWFLAAALFLVLLRAALDVTVLRTVP